MVASQHTTAGVSSRPKKTPPFIRGPKSPRGAPRWLAMMMFWWVAEGESEGREGRKGRRVRVGVKVKGREGGSGCGINAKIGKNMGE